MHACIKQGKFVVRDIDEQEFKFDSFHGFIKEYNNVLQSPYRPEFMKQPYVPSLLLSLYRRLYTVIDVNYLDGFEWT